MCALLVGGAIVSPVAQGVAARQRGAARRWYRKSRTESGGFDSDSTRRRQSRSTIDEAAAIEASRRVPYCAGRSVSAVRVPGRNHVSRKRPRTARICVAQFRDRYRESVVTVRAQRNYANANPSAATSAPVNCELRLKNEDRRRRADGAPNYAMRAPIR